VAKERDNSLVWAIAVLIGSLIIAYLFVNSTLCGWCGGHGFTQFATFGFMVVGLLWAAWHIADSIAGPNMLTEVGMTQAELDLSIKNRKNQSYPNQNTKIECPHCKMVGKVRWDKSLKFSDSQKTNVTVLGVKTIIGTTTKESSTEITKFWCEHCDMEWVSS
jgi:hypothetical protein